MNRNNIFTIFTDIIKCFLISCGLAEIVFFFNQNGDPAFIDPMIYKRLVYQIFSISVVLLLFIRFFIWMHSNIDSVETYSLEAINKPVTKNVIAHEAGHALMAYLQGTKHIKVVLSERKTIMSIETGYAEEIRKHILIDYAGYAAEKIIIGTAIAGSMGQKNTDFEMAVLHIKSYIVMTDESVSKTMLGEELADKIVGLSKELYEECQNLLLENRDKLEILISYLEKHDTISENKIFSLLGY